MTESVGDGQRFGRSWADLLARGFGWVLVVVAVVLLFIFGGSVWSAVPVWVWVSLGMSLLWLPYLMERAREGARLVMVADGPLCLTEYRVGRRYPMRMTGAPLWFSSATGSQRMLLTHFDKNSGEAEGSALADATVFDLARDLEAFDRLGRTFAHHLRAERVTAETIGVEVERRVAGYSESWLRLLYGSLELGELEDLLGGDSSSPDLETSILSDDLPELSFDE